MPPKVLVVLTSQGHIPANREKTGWYLPEFAHPYHVFKDKVELTVASPQGGEAPLDPKSVKLSENDKLSMSFQVEQRPLWTHTHKLSDVVSRVGEFDAIFYVGGHGPMFDLTSNTVSLALIQSFSAGKKPVAAVCHGPAALLNATAPSGVPLLSGAKVTGFSNEEEEQVKMSAVMPFLLETELNRVTGGGYVKADQAWGEKVVVSKTAGTDAPLITGQNPASASRVAKEVLKVLGL